VFSDQDKSFVIQDLYKNLKINGYVLNDRDGQKELKKAVHHILYSEDFYISKEVKEAIHPRKAIKISEFDILLIKCLSKGLSQEDISVKLKNKKISPSSTSAIEKRLKFLKEIFNANNSTHLVSLAKDLGVDASHLNIQIYRIRKQFVDALNNACESSNIIERNAGKIRLASKSFRIIKGDNVECDTGQSTEQNTSQSLGQSASQYVNH
jgi:hypothetical protein